MKHNGFTLVELMISLVLGLIVAASALLLFLSGQKNLSLQNAATTVQEDQNFGLAYIARQIRSANLNSPQATIDNATSQSGIVFEPENLNSYIKEGFTNDYATKANTITSNMQTRTRGGSTYGDASSDQLVIQYRPAEVGGYDCEGKIINTTNVYIVERYFVRSDANTESHEINNEQKKALACAASRYSASLNSETKLADVDNGIYENGQIILKRVDLFKVRFLVQDGSNKRYMSLTEYEVFPDTKPRILAVQLGVVSRSTQPANDPVIKDQQEFILMGLDAKVKENQPVKYVRAPLMQTVALRNAFGDR